MGIFSKPTGSADIEKRIADTRARRDKLAADHVVAQKAVAAARERQRSEIVTADDITVQAILQAVATAEAKAAALSGAVSDLDSALQDLEFKAKDARETERREAEAAKVDKSRQAIEKLLPDLSAAAGKLGDVIGRIKAAMPADTALFTPSYRSKEWTDRTGSKHADRDEALAGILAEIAFNALPDLDFTLAEDQFNGVGLSFPLINIDDPSRGVNQGGQRSPASIADAVAALILEPLQAQADELRQGAKTLTVAKVTPEPIDTSRDPIRIFAKRTFSYVSGFHYDAGNEVPETTTIRRHEIRNTPRAVADLAKKRGFAIVSDSAEAQHLASMRPEGFPRNDTPEQLGDVLKLLSKPFPAAVSPVGRDVHAENAAAEARGKLHRSTSAQATEQVRRIEAA